MNAGKEQVVSRFLMSVGLSEKNGIEVSWKLKLLAVLRF